MRSGSQDLEGPMTGYYRLISSWLGCLDTRLAMAHRSSKDNSPAPWPQDIGANSGVWTRVYPAALCCMEFSVFRPDQ